MSTIPDIDNFAKGIIICDHGSRRAQSNDSLKDVAESFAARFGDDCNIVEPAHMELAMPRCGPYCGIAAFFGQGQALDSGYSKPY